MLKGPQFLHFPDINGFNILIVAEVDDSEKGFNYISIRQVISGTSPTNLVTAEYSSNELYEFLGEIGLEMEQLVCSGLEILPGLKMDCSKTIFIPLSNIKH